MRWFRNRRTMCTYNKSFKKRKGTPKDTKLPLFCPETFRVVNPRRASWQVSFVMNPLRLGYF